jgi:hypothetical protein
MNVARLKRKDLTAWLPMMDEVEICCRHISQSQFDAISEASTKGGKRDEKKFRSALARAVVVDWRGLEEDGEPFACTPENVDWLMEESTEFRLLVMDAPLSLNKMLAAEQEAERKNS